MMPAASIANFSLLASMILFPLFAVGRDVASGRSLHNGRLIRGEVIAATLERDVASLQAAPPPKEDGAASDASEGSSAKKSASSESGATTKDVQAFTVTASPRPKGSMYERKVGLNYPMIFVGLVLGAVGTAAIIMIILGGCSCPLSMGGGSGIPLTKEEAESIEVDEDGTITKASDAAKAKGVVEGGKWKIATFSKDGVDTTFSKAAWSEALTTQDEPKPPEGEAPVEDQEQIGEKIFIKITLAQAEEEVTPPEAPTEVANASEETTGDTASKDPPAADADDTAAGGAPATVPPEDDKTDQAGAAPTP